MQQQGAQILINALKDAGVTTIFGYPGGAVLEPGREGVLIVEA